MKYVSYNGVPCFVGGRSKLGYSNSGFNSPGRKVLLGFVNINFLGVYRDEGVLWFVVWGHLNWFKIDLSLSLLKPVFFIFNRRERNRFKANKTSPSLSLKLQTQYHLAFYGFLSTNSSLLTRGLLFLKYQDSEFFFPWHPPSFMIELTKHVHLQCSRSFQTSQQEKEEERILGCCCGHLSQERGDQTKLLFSIPGMLWNVRLSLHVEL